RYGFRRGSDERRPLSARRLSPEIDVERAAAAVARMRRLNADDERARLSALEPHRRKLAQHASLRAFGHNEPARRGVRLAARRRPLTGNDEHATVAALVTLA